MRRIQVQITVLLTLIALVAGALALVASTASAQQSSAPGVAQVPPPNTDKTTNPTTSGRNGAKLTAPAAPAAPFVTLYDQYDNASAAATSSQDFETANDAFDDQVGDDFVVTGGNWAVNEVDLAGQYYNGAGPAASFNVFFYTNSGTLPSTPVYTATGLAYTNTSGAFVIPLTTAANLTNGTTYWVSVQARQDFTPNGQFGWTDRTVAANSPAAFRNPGGGFACSSNNWVLKTSCVTGSGPDQVFRLVGTIGGGGTATPTATACPVNYDYTSTTSTMITGTTRIDGTGCDDCLSTIAALPFPFTLYGTVYNAASAGSNGVLAFGTAANGFSGSCLPVATATYEMMPFFRDQRTDCTGCGVYTATTGTAPNRVFTIEYRTIYYGQPNTAPTLDYAVNLYESGATAFSYAYGTIGTASGTGRIISVGVQRDGTVFKQYACDPTGLAAPVVSGQQLNWTLASCSTPSATPVSSTPTRTPTAGASTATPTCVAGGGGAPGPWRTVTTAPTPPSRYRAGGVSNGTYVYVFGGSNSAAAYLTDMWRWDPATETWTQLANMPTGKSNIQGAYWNGKIYVPGGYTGAHITENAIYDIGTNTWTTGAPLPAAQSGNNAAYNGKIYNIGGNPGPQTTVSIYDIGTNTWSTGAPLPAATTYARAITVGSYIYYVGGIAGTTTAAVYRYDPVANSWATMAPLQTARTSTELATDGTSIFAMGGGDATFFTGVPLPQSVEIYNISSNTWTYGNPLVTKVAAPSGGGVTGGKVMISNGVDNATYPVTVQVSDVTGGSGCASPTPGGTATPVVNTPTVGPTATCVAQAGGWTTGQPLPTVVVRSVGVYFPANGKVYGMGGRTSDAAGSDRVNPLEYTPGGAWVNKAGVYPDNQVNNMACGVITVSGIPYIYCVGGSAAGAATATARVFRYNPATDVVSAVTGDDWPGNAGGTVLPGGFAVANNKLYILGGFNINVAMTNEIWEYDPNGGTHWTQKVNLPVTRGYIPATTIGGMIYTGGGSDYTTTVIDTADSFKFDPAANTIVAIANIPRATGETRAVTVGGQMWVLGGGRVAPNPSNEVDIYDPGTNTWSVGMPFLTARRNFIADSDGTRVWTAGGYDSSGTTLLDVTENYSPSVVCGTVTVTPTAPAASPTRTTGPTNTVTPPPAASVTRTATTGATSTRTVTATPQPTACAVSFNDVPVGSTFYDYIRCLACRGIVGGYPCGGPGEPCPGNYYRPNNNVTRGQVSKIVSESAGFNDAVPSTQQTFEDVPPGSTFALWIERLSVRGIISGYPCGGPFEPCVSPGNRPYFRPNNNVTRGQLSKITSGAAGWTETPTSQTFEDAPPGSTFYVYIERMASRGIITGYPCGSSAFEPCVAPANRPYFRPNNNATRGQMAKIAAAAFFPNCQTPAVAPGARPAPGQPTNQ